MAGEGNNDLELSILRLAWRADAIDRWRDELDAWRLTTNSILDGLTTADKIAEAVAEKMSSTRTVRFTRVQVALAFLTVSSAWAAIILSLVGHQ